MMATQASETTMREQWQAAWREARVRHGGLSQGQPDSCLATMAECVAESLGWSNAGARYQRRRRCEMLLNLASRRLRGHRTIQCGLLVTLRASR